MDPRTHAHTLRHTRTHERTRARVARKCFCDVREQCPSKFLLHISCKLKRWSFYAAEYSNFLQGYFLNSAPGWANLKFLSNKRHFEVSWLIKITVKALHWQRSASDCKQCTAGCPLQDLLQLWWWISRPKLFELVRHRRLVILDFDLNSPQAIFCAID